MCLCLRFKLWWITFFNNVNALGPLKSVELYRFFFYRNSAPKYLDLHWNFEIAIDYSNLCVLILRNQRVWTTCSAWWIVFGSHTTSAQTVEPWNQALNKHLIVCIAGAQKQEHSDLTANFMLSVHKRKYPLLENQFMTFGEWRMGNCQIKG